MTDAGRRASPAAEKERLSDGAMVLERLEEELEREAARLPDSRSAVFDLRLETRGGKIVLCGSTTDPVRTEELAGRLRAAARPMVVRSRVRPLPDQSQLGDRTAGIVRHAWVPARREPRHQAELVSQWICGEPLALLEEQGDWLRCRSPDGYIAWTPGGGIIRVSPARADAWRRVATGFALGARFELPDGMRSIRLPWGARVEPVADGKVRLADGSIARPETRTGWTAVMEPRLPDHGSAVVESARRWLGVPYVWGGRTDWGTDCSGFVQALFAAHGIELPRDSDQQLARGPRVNPEQGFEPGDLVFFAERPDRVSHVAMAVGGSTIIHAAASNGAVECNDLNGDRPLEGRLRRWLAGATRPLAAAGASV